MGATSRRNVTWSAAAALSAQTVCQPVLSYSPCEIVFDLNAAELNSHGGVFCPSPLANMTTWNTHPKVFLDVAKTGSAKCPYCGTEYALKAGEHAHGHH